MADSFRKRQVIADLVTVARQATVSTLSRMADNAPPAERNGMAAYLTAAIAAGGRISGPSETAIRETAMLTASLPDLDYDAFAAATALVLADGLQDGGDDTMFWHWDAFQAHYALAPRPVRAAILQGYLAGAESGRFRVEPLPPRSVSTSEPEVHVTRDLRRMVSDPVGSGALRDMAAAVLLALENTNPKSAAELWTARGREVVEDDRAAARTVQRGVRYLFERDSAFEPATIAPLLPSLPDNERDTARRA